MNYYKILEVDRDASPEVIEKAYKTLVKKYHPDLQEANLRKISEEKIKVINQAYEVLSNPNSRAKYDETLKQNEISEEDFNRLSEENKNLYNEINNLKSNNVSNNYNKDDIPLIKVLYLEIKDGCSDHMILCSAIKTDIRLIKNLDEKGKNVCAYRSYQYRDMWKIEHFKNKLLTQEQRILDSDSRHKDLLLFSIRSAFYELELLSGKRVTDVLKHLESMEVVNQHQERKKEYEIEALIKAYYNLTDINFRANSMYFSDDDYIFAKFETADFEINKRLLKMMKR